MNVSVFLPLCDCPERNRACLESLARTLPPRWQGEILLLAADHPEIASVLPPAVRDRCRVLLHDSPRRLSILRGVSAPVLCFLDPGVVLLPDWLPPMFRLLQTAANAGCIGNIQREPYSGLIDHAGIGFDADGLPFPVGRNLALLPRAVSDRRAAVSMACCLVRRSVFEQLGGFDPRFRSPLGGVDLCLRAAEAGFRHYVSNRSVVYHFDDAAPVADDPDLPLYRERWGDRARRCHARRVHLRYEPPGAPFSAERWEMARETRRLFRLDIGETHRQGRRYLLKHWYRPWRYNAARVARAIRQTLEPLPAPLPPIPGGPADSARSDDGWLFDPPPQP